jgi:DNA-directed RNA polymerase subunit F
VEEIIRERLVTGTEAKKILKNRKKEIELGYEQKNAYDHLKKYDKLTEKKMEELFKALSEVKKLRDRQVISIINTLPKDKDDLRLLLEKDYNLLTEEEKNIILNNVNKFI